MPTQFDLNVTKGIVVEIKRTINDYKRGIKYLQGITEDWNGNHEVHIKPVSEKIFLSA